ncbi:11827_t:CDS:1 [Acaulospora colombiana]|uniref:11827_t:CDS:1 n=1 Tax=Acaulospora colombiana TaxID=27376 RepID=A0ACA9LHF1_9GLOM|nr:11827_t:CDS:1 [Acaulospora colombiana]
MTLPIPTNMSQQPMSEIKQSKVKRLSWKVGSKIPKFIRTPSSQTKRSESFGSGVDTVNDRENLSNLLSSSPSDLTSPKYNANKNVDSNTNRVKSKEYATLGANNNSGKVDVRDIPGIYAPSESFKIENNYSAPSLILNLEKLSTTTTKTQKKNIKASPSKTLPRNFWRLIGKKNKPPELVTTPLSPSPTNQFSYTSPFGVPEKVPKKRRGNRPISGNFSLAKQTLVNLMLRKGRNQSPEDSSTTTEGDPVTTYESFPDPDREDFINVNSWDLPDSLSATEDAAGVLQMIEYDGIYINGVKVN